MAPACAQACPTDSIQFGTIRELKQRPRRASASCTRWARRGRYLYGADDKVLGGLNSFYLLVDKPEVYGLPRAPKMPSRNLVPSSLFSAAGAIVLALLGFVGLRKRRMDEHGQRGRARMSDTFFTATPHWTWWIVFYFFIGGIAGSGFLLSSLLYSPAGRPTGRSARWAYLMSFIGVGISGLLLTVDLDRPLRFWHMLIESNTGLRCSSRGCRCRSGRGACCCSGCSRSWRRSSPRARSGPA